MLHSVLFEFSRNRWARTNEAHIALQHIPQLGQLIQTPFSEETSQFGDTRIIGYLEENSVPLVEMLKRFLALFRIDNHRSKFMTNERVALFPQSHRVVKYGTLRILFNQNRDQEE